MSKVATRYFQSTARHLFGLLAALVIILVGMPCCAEVAHDPLAAIERAYDARVMTVEQKAVLQLTAIVSPADLPTVYRAEARVPSRCASMTILDIYKRMDSFSPETKAVIFKLLQRPTCQKSVVSPDGFFRLHYDTVGGHFVPLVDIDENGIPDMVDKCASFCDTSLAVQLALGYVPPPSDTGLGGDTLYDVYFRETPYYGYCVPEGDGPELWDDSFGYLVLNRDFEGFPPNSDPEGDVLGAARATCAHEFHHAIQYAYDIDQDTWFMELDATHVEDLVFDQVDDNYNYLPEFFGAPSKSLMTDGIHAYASFVWGLYLAEKFDPTVIRRTWEGVRTGDDIYDALSDSLQSTYGWTQDSAFADFCTWTFITGLRDDGLHFAEAAEYPQISPSINHHLYPVDTTVAVGKPQAYSACYVEFTRDWSKTGRLRIEFNGADTQEWAAFIIKSVGDDSHEIEKYSLNSTDWTGYLDVEDYEDYQRIVLVAVNLSEFDTTSSEFTYCAHMSTDRAVSIEVGATEVAVYSTVNRQYEFNMENPSILFDSYDVVLSDDSGWVQSDTLQVDVPPGGQTPVSITIAPPHLTPIGMPLGHSSQLSVRAVSSIDPWTFTEVEVPIVSVLQYGDLDYTGKITMGDLTLLIDHLFISLAPLEPIAEAGDFDCLDGLATMSDLTALINFLFINLDQNSPCNPY